MSWNMYVTELLHSKQATKAAIYGLDGTRYVGSDGLNLTKEQIDEIIDWVSENGVLSGVYQRSGFTAAKTNKVIIIGYYDNNSGIQKGPNRDQVQHMAETLKKKGY